MAALTKAEMDQHLEKQKATEMFDDLTRQTSSQIFEFKDQVVKLQTQIKELHSKVKNQQEIINDQDDQILTLKADKDNSDLL